MNGTFARKFIITRHTETEEKGWTTAAERAVGEHTQISFRFRYCPRLLQQNKWVSMRVLQLSRRK